jgi:hypothetical protein
LSISTCCNISSCTSTHSQSYSSCKYGSLSEAQFHSNRACENTGTTIWRQSLTGPPLLGSGCGAGEWTMVTWLSSRMFTFLKVVSLVHSCCKLDAACSPKGLLLCALFTLQNTAPPNSPSDQPQLTPKGCLENVSSESTWASCRPFVCSFLLHPGHGLLSILLSDALRSRHPRRLGNNELTYFSTSSQQTSLTSSHNNCGFQSSYTPLCITLLVVRLSIVM